MKRIILYLFLLLASYSFAQQDTTKTVANDIDFTVYPNPVRSSFKINTEAAILKVRIYNVLGKEVAVFNKQVLYTVADLKKGIYLLHLETKRGVAVRKLIIK